MKEPQGGGAGDARAAWTSRTARIIHDSLPLTPGTRLGPYEIVAALGAGGMGEVYKARDSRLDRETGDGLQKGMIQLGMVQYHLEMGDVDGFIEWLERAVELREPLAVVFVGGCPTELVRSNPRWTSLMRAMNLEP